VKPIRLHKESQPLEKLEEVIEEIRRLMLRSAHDTASKETLRRRKSTIAVGMKQQ